MTPTAKYFDMYPVDEHIMPVSINDDMANSPYFKSNGRHRETEYADPEKLKYMMSEYYGLLTEIDDWVGAILDKLDALGLAENTMVIFTSDHGEMLGAHGMREKNVFLEESAHIPLLIKIPGVVPEKTTVNGYVSNVDLFSTILDYLEVPEEESEGKSLRGLIDGTDTEHGEYVVTEWGNDKVPNLMILKDGWKLIIPNKANSTIINTMYDLNTDPHEMNNLLGSNPDRGQYQVEAEELRADLLEWLANNNSAHYNNVSRRNLLNGGELLDNDASFVSQVVPSLEGDTPITVSITMKNTGTTNWTAGGDYKLGSQSPEDNNNWGLSRVNLGADEIIVPNAEKTFTFDVVVPNSDGIYNFQWQMIKDGNQWFGSKSAIQQLVLGSTGTYLDDADSKTDWKPGALTLNTIDKKQGTASLEYTGSSTDEFKKVFSTPFDANGTEAGTVLQFWYYASDPSQFQSSNQVEISSSGGPDTDEYNWNLGSNLNTGWNFIQLNTKDAGKSGNPNLSAINWFRLYRKKNGSVTTRIDGIQLIGENNLGINKVTNEKLFKMYPNPLKNELLIINILPTNNNSVEVIITNLLGQTVYEYKTKKEEEITIDTKGLLKSPFYIVTVKSGKSISSAKLIVE